MTDYERLRELVKKAGMDAKWSGMFIQKLKKDELAFSATQEQKEWALSRGFYPGRVELYGLTEENCHLYIPDYSYFMLHPLNHHFRIWINDKLSLKYTLNSNGCADTMPEYYLYIENNGNYTYLMDAPEDVAHDEHFLMNLLKKKNILAVKPNSGTSGGRGFMKLEYRGTQLYENNVPIDEQQLENEIRELRNYVVTEYVRQHSEMAAVWPDSECTLRVIMCKLPYKTPYADAIWKNVVANARFGAACTGGASNVSSGGIGVGFDFETGEYRDYGLRHKNFCPDGNWKCFEHPDSGFRWAGKAVPNWPFVREKIMQICRHISSLDYLGLDVIISEDGMKLCEINTHPAADYIQVMHSPFLQDAQVRSFFESKGLNKIDTREFYRMYMECQTEE